MTEAAEAVAAAAAELGDTGAAIVMAARAVALADDLTKARAAFGLLSDAVIGYAREVGLGELRLAFCPHGPQVVDSGGRLHQQPVPRLGDAGLRVVPRAALEESA